MNEILRILQGYVRDDEKDGKLNYHPNVVRDPFTNRMDCDGAPPVLDTRNVLLSHLKAKIQSIKCIVATEELLEEITRDLSNNDILFLLENENELLNKTENSKLCQIIEKEAIGEDLFVAVSQINSELCAQLTGMLLELDIGTVKNLIKDPQSLKEAVLKAKQEYMKYTKGNLKYILGEELFELVLNRYKNEGLASQLTGMLLELDTETLHRLISNPTELHEKLDTAYSVLNVKCNQ